MSKSQTTKLPKPTAEERKLTQTQVQLAQTQLAALRQAQQFQSDLYKRFPDLVAQFEADAAFARDQAQAVAPLQKRLAEAELARIETGGAATPEQQALIRQQTAAAYGIGSSDIERAARGNLELLREELAPALGLRPTDTPILDRGARVAEEATRQKGQLGRQLAGQEAGLLLDYPLSANQLASSQTQFQQQLQESTRQFQEQLRNQAYLNRLQLQQGVGSLGLELPQIGNFGSAGLNATVQARMAQPTTTIKDPVGQSAQIMQGLGQLASGIGGAAYGFNPPKPA